MSICMPLSNNSLRPEFGVRRSNARLVTAGRTEDDRIEKLEARLDQLESGQRTALDLVRRALTALQETQTEQNAAHGGAAAHLAARLDRCEAALARLNEAQRRDDETMRERLFDLSEAMEGVRATAASAVKPGAMRRLERALGQEIEACAQTLRTEFGERITEAVEAAESRSASALEAIEETFWDDITELARRFDSVADTVVKVGLELEPEDGGEDGRGFGPETAPGTEDAFCLPENGHALPENGHALPDEEATPEVIPFRPRPPARTAQDGTDPDQLADIGAVLTAAARRADAAEAPPEPQEDQAGGRRALAPLGRMVASAGTAVIAVCIMGGLSLLAGPTLGPSFQGAPPAFAHDTADWTPVEAAPRPVVLMPHLKPTLRTNSVAYPSRETAPAKSED